MSLLQSQADEVSRIRALENYAILDTEPDPRFDGLAEVAARLFGCPAATISFIDTSRQWLKSCIGLNGLRETARDEAFCNHTILSDQPLLVPDATLDPRFAHNPAVTGSRNIRFYLGAPLINPDGYRLGSLCVIDYQPRPFTSQEDIRCLQDLAAQVVDQLETQRIRRQLAAIHRSLTSRELEVKEERRHNLQLKEQIDLALEAGQMGVWEWNGISDYIASSPSFERIFGFASSPGGVLRDVWANAIHVEDREAVRAKLETCLNGGPESETEYRITRPDGTHRWILGRARRRFFPASQSIGVVGVSCDITDRKVAELRLREQQEIERGWSAASNAGIFRLDESGCGLAANPRFQQLIGSPVEQCFRQWQSFIHPDESTEVYREWKQALAQGLLYEREHRIVSAGASARWIQMRLVPLKAAGGEITGFLGAIDDITPRKQTEQELAGLQQLLQLAVDSMPQRVFWKDLNSIYKGCNQSFANDMGLMKPGDVIGKSDFELHPPHSAEEYRESDRQVISSGLSCIDLEQQIELRSGARCLIRKTKTPLRDVSGTVVGILGIYDDITVQRRKESELTAAKEAAEAAARTRGQFLANMSHEIRTPLNGVLGMISLLLDSSLGPEQRHWAETAHLSGEALLRLLNNILDLSKMEAGKLTVECLPFNLHRTVQQCVELLQAEARAKGLQLQFNYDATPTHLVGDSFRVRQILINFLANAVKFTAKGSVVLHVQSCPKADNLVQVKIAVQDTGIGIAHEAEPSLFQPFSQADGSTTRRFGGTGLGLSIAKQLAELMAGTIGYTPNPGGGSIFWVEIPMQLAPAVLPEEKPLASDPACLLERKILIVEDNPVNQLVTSRFVTKLGCRVTIAANGREALEQCKNQSFDLVLMDGQMPELDGYQATAALRQKERALNLKRMPIVALTAHALPGDKERCLAAGMDDYLSKPVQPQALKQTLELWLGPRSSSPEKSALITIPPSADLETRSRRKEFD